MRRLARAALPLALLAALAITGAVVVGVSHAELENQVFTSRADRLLLVVPRGWRATDHPTYPGLLLWMMRTQPPGQIVLTSEAFTRDLYCSWPPACRAAIDTPTGKYVCALRAKLAAQRFRVGPVQAGPKENAVAGIPSVWFEYDDGKRFLRQAVTMTEDQAISLVLSAPTSDARASHTRPFDQALRTLRTLSAAEAVTVTTDGGVVISDAPGDAATAPTSDALPEDAGTIIDAAPKTDPTVGYASAPAPKIEPVGPCPQ